MRQDQEGVWGGCDLDIEETRVLDMITLGFMQDYVVQICHLWYNITIAPKMHILVYYFFDL